MHTICYSLVNNQLLSVRKSFMIDIGRFKSVNTNIELKAEFDDTVRQLIECEYNILHI